MDGQAPYADHTGLGPNVETPSATNYVLNPSGTSTLNWYHNTSVSTMTSEGGRIKVVYSGAAGGAQTLPGSAVIPVSVNDIVWLTFKYQGPGLGKKVIVHHRAAGDVIVEQTVVDLPNSPNAETRVAIRVNVTNPSVVGLYLAQLGWTSGGANLAGETHFFSQVLFTKTNSAVVPDYFDGNSYGASWQSTVNNSLSYGHSTYPKHAALVKGASSAVLVGNTNKLNFDAPIMKQGKEDQAFTIEVTVRLIRKENSVAQIQVFGTGSAMDGLVIAGTVVSFTTKYTNSGEARCEFDVQEYQTLRIQALHTSTRNALYINGDLVDEVAITDEQQADTYLATGNSLTAGTSSGPNLIAMNGLAVYPRALDEGDIDEHVDEASDNMDEFTVGAAYDGVTFALNSSTSLPIIEYVYTDEYQWQMGRLSGTVIDNEQIVPQAVGGVSLPGVWEAVIPLPPEQTLSSVTLNWLGEGETVETSLDGINWNEERRAAKISTIGDGFDTTDKVLFIRVSFPGGVVNDRSYFDSLVISIYGPVSTVAPTLETRTLTMVNASIEADYDITDYHENWGVEINNGSMTLSGSTPTAMAPRTIQVWAKKGMGDFSDNLQATASGWYTNDGTYSQAYQTDEWQLRTYTFTSGHSGEISFTGTGQIGCILIYAHELTSQQIKDTYTSFTGTVTTSFPDSGTVTFVDISSNVEIYEYDWAIESAG